MGRRALQRRGWALSFAWCVGGCSGLGHTVDRHMLRDISIENKLQLFEAENELAIAVDERENIIREGQQVRRQKDATLAGVDDAREDRGRAADKADAKAEALAALAIEVLELKIEFLNAMLDHIDDRLNAQEDLTRVALAKFELAKARIVKRNNVSGASGIDLADFEAQVDRCVETARDAQRDVSRAEAEVAQARAKWISERARLEKQSDGGLGSAWAEDEPAWGWQ